MSGSLEFISIFWPKCARGIDENPNEFPDHFTPGVPSMEEMLPLYCRLHFCRSGFVTNGSKIVDPGMKKKLQPSKYLLNNA